MDVVEAVRRVPNAVLHLKFQASLTVIHRALTLYSPQQVAFSFNGGKDSTVLLHILRAAVAQQAASAHEDSGPPPSPLSAITSFVFDDVNEFDEVRSFTREQIEKWEMNCRVFPTSVKFAEGLQQLIDKHDLKACILGTRRGDPNADDQDVFCPSSRGWPPFMRINPILDWTYEDVWAFLLGGGAGGGCGDPGWAGTHTRSSVNTRTSSVRFKNVAC
jgi:FAD synthetase